MTAPSASEVLRMKAPELAAALTALRASLAAAAAQLQAAGAQLDAVTALLAAVEDQADNAPPACPYCGGLKLEPTPDLSGARPHRHTCLSCGKSFDLEVRPWLNP